MNQFQCCRRGPYRPLAAVCAFLFALCCLPVAAATEELPAQTLIRTTAESFMSQLRAEASLYDADPSRILTSAEQMLLPHFDFNLISQRALGRHWRSFSDDQKTRFIQEFRSLLLRTYAHTLNDNRDATVSFLPSHKLSAAATRVRTEVSRPDGPPVRIDYEVRQRRDGLRICDVVVNGVSLIISYRAGFQKDIGSLGAEGLIAQLAERNGESS